MIDHNKNNENADKEKNKRKQTFFVLIIAAIVTLIGISTMTTVFNKASTKEISYSVFLEMVEKNEIDKVEITYDGKLVITPAESLNKAKNFTYWTAQIEEDEDFVRRLNEKDIEFYKTFQDSTNSVIDIILVWVVPFALMYFVLGFLFKKISKGSGMMGVGKSNAKVYIQKDTGVTFKDVAGQEEAKESLTEIVDFLHNPKKYREIGAKLPKGALLVGPPGTGKTLLAKAVAGEANVPFFSLSGSDFVEMFVGVGASRVRDLFKKAQQEAPCIIFIDEIDAIGKSRDSRFSNGNDEREQTLNQLLSEMDGFDASKGILILAATNRPDVLDHALLRPGRFDRRIIVDKPDLRGRVETLRVHSKDVAMDETVDFEAIGLATPGAVGSDLANIINEAAINAVKKGRQAINQADLFESVEVVIAGKEKKDRILSKEEKKTVSYHEVGHALVTALMKNAEPVQKITIVPRTMGSLGYVMQVPEDEKYLMSKAELETKLITLLAGRASEELVFNSITTGASNDMEKATKLARNMIAQYGMSDALGLMSLEQIDDKYLGGKSSLNCSEEMAARVDEEISKLLKVSYEKAKNMLSEHRKELDLIASYLYDNETITGTKFMELFKLANQ